MKILLVNWSWYPTGGDWTYVDNVRALYEMHGHEVIPLSTINEKNVPAKEPSYFVNSPDYKQLNKNKNFLNSYKAVKSSIVSSDALKKVEQALAENDIQIAHLHNIHHYITPAIIWKLKKAGVKIIWSLHDYKIICPESLFISNGKICEKCMNGNFFHCTLNRCKKKSLPASMLATAEAFFYHKSGVYQKVDAYLCPSNFLKNKFSDFGVKDSRLHVSNLCYNVPLIDNFISEYSNTGIVEKEEKYILYVGRIEKVKGIRTLIHAVKGTNIKLKIAGTGAADEELREFVKNEQLTNVEFLGFQNKQSVFDLTLHSKFVVCPSEWYENFPFSIIESFLFSKPVIGSNIGGIPELVKDNETGHLFEPGNVNDLREKLVALWNNEALAKEMGTKARKHIYDIVNFETHWTKLNFVINSILNNGN